MLPTAPAPSPRRRRLAALVLTAGVVVAPLTAGAPAAAVTAPLVTDDGIGVRIDETAVSEVFDDLEAAIVPAVETAVEDGALAYNGFDDPDWIDSSFSVGLALDLAAPTTGFPDGSLRLRVTVDDLLMRMYRYGEWWQPECLMHVDDFGALFMDATYRFGTTALPGSPGTLGPLFETWSSATPQEGPATGYSTLCNGYTNGFDWAGYSDVSDPASPAGQTKALLQTAVNDLAEQMWDDDAWPVLRSLNTLAGFDVDVAQLRAEDHGLVATADVDATAGVTVAGWGPYPVGSAEDAGVTSNVNTLLATRTLGGVASDIIVSLHPNVTNQYLTALHDRLNGSFGTTAISSAIATALVDPTLGTCYTATGWSTRLEAQAPPHLTPTGTGGAPEMQLPQTTIQFRNPGCNPTDPRVATFTGSLDDIAVTTTGTPLAPRGSAATAAWTATRTQADAATAARVPPATSATLVSWAQGALATFLTNHVPGHVDLTVDGFPGHGATHCTTCGRYPGDQRITETFHIT